MIETKVFQMEQIEEIRTRATTTPRSTVEEYEWDWVDTKPLEWEPKVHEVEELVTDVLKSE